MKGAKAVGFLLILVAVLIWVNNIIMYKVPYDIDFSGYDYIQDWNAGLSWND